MSCATMTTVPLGGLVVGSSPWTVLSTLDWLVSGFIRTDWTTAIAGLLDRQVAGGEGVVGRERTEGDQGADLIEGEGAVVAGKGSDRPIELEARGAAPDREIVDGIEVAGRGAVVATD